MAIASGLFARLKGLLGKSGLAQGEALWIDRCNSIHTCFMRFPIDVVFVDDRMMVRKIHRNLPPWRLTWPVLKASSVIEMPAGTLQTHLIEVGDELHVGD